MPLSEIGGAPQVTNSCATFEGFPSCCITDKIVPTAVSAAAGSIPDRFATSSTNVSIAASDMAVILELIESLAAHPAPSRNISDRQRYRAKSLTMVTYSET